jgi:hypothetical protein
MPYTPRFDVDIRIDVDVARLHLPSSARSAFDGMFNSEYRSLWRSSWMRAAFLAKVEKELIDQCIADACDADDFHGRFRETELEFDEDFLDLGVAAAVRTLNAAGCATFTSCNGHQHGFPTILLTATAEQADLLSQAADSAETGLVNHVDGALEAFADWPGGLVRFAEELERLKKTFITIKRRRAAPAQGTKYSPRLTRGLE